MRLISTRAWLLVVLSAGLQIFMFPTGGPMPAWRASICWFALVPFFWALSLPGKDGLALSLRNSFALGYMCGFLWYFGNCFWIYQTMYLYGGMPKPMAFGIVILFSLYLGLYHAFFAWLFGVFHRFRGSLLAIVASPFLWVAIELARARITGFPWDLLGYTQIDDGLVTRIAPVAGVMGIGFLIVLVNACFLPVLLGKGKTHRTFAGLAMLLVIGLQLGSNRYHAAASAGPPLHQATLLQENLSVGATAQEKEPETLNDEIKSFTALSAAPQNVLNNARQATKADVIVWPEAPAHLQTNAPSTVRKLSELASGQSTPVIAGSLGVEVDPTSARGYRLHDSAILFASDGTYVGRYDKVHLVPWGEYVPYEIIFGFVHKLTEGLGNMDRGTDRSVFLIGGHQYGIFVCYESIFGNEVREFAKGGAEVLVNISDDGWYGETGAPWQHLAMVRMRAVENHRWILRSTNTGVTTSIDPLGRVAVEAPRHVRAAFLFPFAFEQGTTFYTRHGDWFADLCTLVTLLALAATLSVAKKPLLK